MSENNAKAPVLSSYYMVTMTIYYITDHWHFIITIATSRDVFDYMN